MGGICGRTDRGSIGGVGLTLPTASMLNYASSTVATMARKRATRETTRAACEQRTNCERPTTIDLRRCFRSSKFARSQRPGRVRTTHELRTTYYLLRSTGVGVFCSSKFARRQRAARVVLRAMVATVDDA